MSMMERTESNEYPDHAMHGTSEVGLTAFPSPKILANLECAYMIYPALLCTEATRLLLDTPCECTGMIGLTVTFYKCANKWCNLANFGISIWSISGCAKRPKEVDSADVVPSRTSIV